jgi:hypothetical protein
MPGKSLEAAVALAVLPHLAVAIANRERVILAPRNVIGAILVPMGTSPPAPAANAADEGKETVNR